MKNLTFIKRKLVAFAGILLFTSSHYLFANSYITLERFDDITMDSFPVPSGNPKQLFYLQRPPNTNTVVYELNVDGGGKLISGDPIHVFWIRYPEGGGRKELTYIQRHFAYGVKAELQEDGRYRLIFAAFKKKNIYLMYAQRDNKYHIYTTLLNKVSILNKVYIHIEPGGTFWAPNVRYIEMKGKELSTGNEIVERIIVAK